MWRRRYNHEDHDDTKGFGSKPLAIFIATILTAVLAAVAAGRLVAQSGAERPVWRTLLQAALPEDSEPFISVNSLAVSEPVREHSHSSPVFAYVVQGEIENQVDPDPPAIHRTGGFFYEAPRQLHKMLRGLSTTETARSPT
jgi:quercetin dioxygenase-like cupin family protein